MENLVPSMNQQLTKLGQFFQMSTESFISQINLHQSRFTHQDKNQFSQLVQQIKKQVNERISNFFNEKISKNSNPYEQQIEKYKTDSEATLSGLQKFRQNLEKATHQLKREGIRNELVMEHFSEKFYLNALGKKYFTALKRNRDDNQTERIALAKARGVYQKKLLRKTFFPWRRYVFSFVYKEGHCTTVTKETQKDIQNIHKQYSSIIQILKDKISQTDQLVKLKKATKSQFAYSLNKNLMKTISNLSMEVMSLNQMSLKDDQFEVTDSQRMMENLTQTISSKINEVTAYKMSLQAETNCTNPSKRASRKITFI